MIQELKQLDYEQGQFQQSVETIFKNFICSRKGSVISQRKNQQKLMYKIITDGNQSYSILAEKLLSEQGFTLSFSIEWKCLNFQSSDSLIHTANNLNLESQISPSKVCVDNDQKIISVVLKIPRYLDIKMLSKRDYLNLQKAQQFLKHIITKHSQLSLSKGKCKQSSQKQIKQIREQIKSVKNAIEQQIRSRKKCTLPPLLEYNIQSQNINSSINRQQISDKVKYSQILSTLKILFIDDKIQPKNSAPILRGIKIMEKQRVQNKFNEGNFGELCKWKSTYQLFNISINNATNLMIAQNIEQKQLQQKINESIKTGYLVEKSMKQPLNRQKYDLITQSFDIEVGIIKFFRNFSESTIASYFLEEISKQNTVQSIYIDYYPQTLSLNRSKIKYYLYIAKNLAKGIQFLNKVGVVHRDLKPNNIMVSQDFLPKLIDFGSSAFIDSKEKKYELLKTTKKYNLYFEATPFNKTKEMTKRQFEQHPNYDIYAFGKIIQQLLLGRQDTKALGQQITKNLFWLIIRCTDVNPQNRVSPLQASIVMNIIWKLWKYQIEKNNKK